MSNAATSEGKAEGRQEKTPLLVAIVPTSAKKFFAPGTFFGASLRQLPHATPRCVKVGGLPLDMIENRFCSPGGNCHRADVNALFLLTVDQENPLTMGIKGETPLVEAPW